MFRSIQKQTVTQCRNFSSVPSLVKPDRPLNILFFGSSDVAVASLDALYKARGSLIGNLEVVVPPLRTKGKKLALTPCDVEQRAVELNLPVHRLPASMGWKMEGFEMPAGSFDLGIVISFGYKQSNETITSFPMNMINAHASTLPQQRGAAPIQYALFHQLDSTGVTIITLDPKTVDAGKIQHHQSIPVTSEDTFSSLAVKVADTAASTILHSVEHWNEIYPLAKEQGTLPPPPADQAKAPKVKKELGCLEWAQMTAKQVKGRYSGLCGFSPAYTFFNNVRMELFGVAMSTETNPILTAPGEFTLTADGSQMLVQTLDGCVTVDKIQLACKNVTVAKDFFNGHLKKKQLTKGLLGV